VKEAARKLLASAKDLRIERRLEKNDGSQLSRW
jgi:hypothetical protein